MIRFRLLPLHMLIAAFLVPALLTGCGSTKKELGFSGTPMQQWKKKFDAPDWVLKGAGAFKDKKLMYGVGSATGIRNPSLLRTTSENRSRAEIAKLFNIFVAELFKDYQASTTAHNPHETSEEQDVRQAQETVTSATLSGVAVIDHWQHPETGELFSLARLDVESFKSTVDKAKELDARTKAYIRENADRMFEELDGKIDR